MNEDMNYLVVVNRNSIRNDALIFRTGEPRSKVEFDGELVLGKFSAPNADEAKLHASKDYGLSIKKLKAYLLGEGGDQDQPKQATELPFPIKNR